MLTRWSDTGFGVTTCGTGPPRMTAKLVFCGASSTYFFASSIARSKFDFPSLTIDIDAEPSSSRTMSFVAPPPKRLRLNHRSPTTMTSVSAARSTPP